MDSNIKPIFRLDDGYEGLLRQIVDSEIPDLLDETLFKGIPILSAMISVYKIGKGVGEIFRLKKTARFLLALNEISDSEKDHYQRRLKWDRKFANKEMEYLLILLDRYIEEEKATVLAKLYYSFLDGRMSFQKFKSLAVALDSIMMEDIKVLKGFRASTNEYGGSESSSLARLVSSGLMMEERPKTATFDGTDLLLPSQSSFREYFATQDGRLFCECLNKYDGEIETAPESDLFHE